MIEEASLTSGTLLSHGRDEGRDAACWAARLTIVHRLHLSSAAASVDGLPAELPVPAKSIAEATQLMLAISRKQNSPEDL